MLKANRPLRRQAILRAAVEQGILEEEQPLVALIDHTGLEATLESLRSAFPPHFTHAFAAKANPLRKVLDTVRSAGLYCEVASAGEIALARAAGFAPEQLVFDKPGKSCAELQQALDLGMTLNLDNYQELEVLEQLLDGTEPNATVGFRINPQIGAGSIEFTSTATVSSKFGVALRDPGARERLLCTYLDRDWLRSIHVHVGSQGCPLDLLAQGVKDAVALAESVNAGRGAQQIATINIGGGLPVDFDSDDLSPRFAAYANLLRREVPALFDGSYRVITEFGRAVLAKNGVLVSRVEYCKTAGGVPIVLTHLGVQILVRNVYMPESWPLRFEAYDDIGSLKHGDTLAQDIAGPCCFSGDLAGRGVMLPVLERGDYVVALDTGAYSFGAHYYYNAFPAPPVYSAQIKDGCAEVSFECWRPQQSIESVVDVIG